MLSRESLGGLAMSPDLRLHFPSGLYIAKGLPKDSTPWQRSDCDAPEKNVDSNILMLPILSFWFLTDPGPNEWFINNLLQSPVRVNIHSKLAMVDIRSSRYAFPSREECILLFYRESCLRSVPSDFTYWLNTLRIRACSSRFLGHYVTNAKIEDILPRAPILPMCLVLYHRVSFN